MTLAKAYPEVKSSSLIFLAGDFNAKVGTRRYGEACVGSHGRGKRNLTGQSWVDFCSSNSLYLYNTTYQHKACHKATWTGWRREAQCKKIVPIFNQIDYIIRKQWQHRMLVDSRSHGGCEVSTDH